MQTTFLARGLRPAAVGVLFVLAVTGAFFLGKAQAQDGITLQGTSLLYQPINADKTGDYEQVLARLKRVMQDTSDPTLRRQAAGWRIYRLNAPPSNGMVNYLHVIEPAVPNANYALMPILYDAITDPDEQRAVYDQYVAAFGGPPTLVGMTLVTDLSE